MPELEDAVAEEEDATAEEDDDALDEDALDDDALDDEVDELELTLDEDDTELVVLPDPPVPPPLADEVEKPDELLPPAELVVALEVDDFDDVLLVVVPPLPPPPVAPVSLPRHARARAGIDPQSMSIMSRWWRTFVLLVEGEPLGRRGAAETQHRATGAAARVLPLRRMSRPDAEGSRDPRRLVTA